MWHGPRPTFVPSGILVHPAVWPQDIGQKLGAVPLLGEGSWVRIQHNVAWAKAYLHAKCHHDPFSRLATVDMGRKLGGKLCPVLGRGAGSPTNTMWPVARSTCTPSFILIHPTVWPQYTNVTYRTDRQRSDSIWPTVLQTVA